MDDRGRSSLARLKSPSAHGQTIILAALGALLVPLLPALAAPAAAAAGVRCADIPRLLASKGVAAASELVSATPNAPAHCRVDLVPERAINIRVGLPLSAADGGTGGAHAGAWNGRVINLGGGGYGGSVPDVSMALRRGEVGSATDTGHSAAWCNAIAPETGRSNAQPDCGLAGGGFVLDPAGDLLGAQVKDFMRRSLEQQTTWALRLSGLYHRAPAVRNYWVGASTGGRQGWEMAQRYGERYDGFLLGFPAVNWNRFIIAEAWPAVVVDELLGPGGLSPAKSDAANAAAVAGCDGDDGVVDGTIAEPRRCRFDAAEVDVLSSAEARAVNLIWDGPRTADGGRLWGGITRGTSFSTLLPGGTGMNPMIETYLRYWLYQDAEFDWREELTIENFPEAFAFSERKFRTVAATDATDLSGVRRGGAKIISYHGTNDSLIVPFGSYNYQQRLFDRYGVAGTRSFARTFYFPGVDHFFPTLDGGGPAQEQLFDALVAWTEKGRAPEHFSQTFGPGQKRTVCAFPDSATGNGPCQTNERVPGDLVAESRTVMDRP